MSDDNGKNSSPAEHLHFERNHIECRVCGYVFTGLVFEAIDGLEQIRISDGLVELLRLRCLHCGEIFNWSPTEKAMRQMAADYHELLEKSRDD